MVELVQGKVMKPTLLCRGILSDGELCVALYVLFHIYDSRFYIGRQPCVLITDLEMLKQVMAGEYESFLHRPVSNFICTKLTFVITKVNQAHISINN